MAIYNKIKADCNLTALQSEINANPNIVPSCIAITSESNQLYLTFAASLSSSEETLLDELIVDHVAPEELISVTTLPRSAQDGKKLLVHSTSKPEIDGVSYSMWVGAGDDLSDVNNQLNGGQLLELSNIPGSPMVVADVKFNPIHGRVWIHEAYLKFENGGAGDYIEGFVVAEPTPLQQIVNLDLVVSNEGDITYAGPGAGTHGFADPSKIQLLSRSFSSDGDWDYSLATGLVPNLSNTGQYKINNNESTVHRYYGKIPCRGTCNTFFSMTSDETALLPPNYFVRIITNNVSNTTWFATIIMEIFRERTYLP